MVLKPEVNDFSVFGRVKIEDMKADKGQFDEVLRRMLQKPPQKESQIRAEKKPKKAQDQKSDQQTAKA